MRIRYRRAVTKLGPIRINRSGPRLTSITTYLTPWHTWVIWERSSR